MIRFLILGAFAIFLQCYVSLLLLEICAMLKKKNIFSMLGYFAMLIKIFSMLGNFAMLFNVTLFFNVSLILSNS